ncbi:MAG TPA: transcription antitermination factor NusB [Streptosporangiaceae bacterium]|nr:transcription antitermination factor NusB [Streptosporangiaceae bacterium]
MAPERGPRPAHDRRPGSPRDGRPAAAQRAREPRKFQGPQKSRKPQKLRDGRTEPARRTAYDVLYAVAERGAYANLLLPALLRERGIGGRDAALATELAYGTLRGLQTYDAILDLCSDRRPGAVDPPLREVLRLGAHQLLATRVASHAAVATSVDLAKDVAGTRPAGFVNAVLRRVATRSLDEWLRIIAPDRSADPIGYLATRYGHPRWIAESFRDALGEGPGSGLGETEMALAAGNEPPRLCLAAVPGLADRAELTGSQAVAARWSPFGAALDGGDPAALPPVAGGRAIVQDEASQMAALALARAPLTGPDHAWLDMCAGPGGKAALLAGLAAGRGARLLASDVRPHRARLVRSRTGRLGSAAVVVADGRAPAWRAARPGAGTPAGQSGGAFDRVLADVPCSGLGALRRRPEARWRKSPEDVAGLAGLQRDLLDAGVGSARPGGVIAYVTCSPHVAETRDVVGDVVAGRGDVSVLDAPAVLAEVPGLRCPDPHGTFAQFWPHRHGTDAIFIALLRREPTAW